MIGSGTSLSVAIAAALLAPAPLADEGNMIAVHSLSRAGWPPLVDSIAMLRPLVGLV